MDSNIYSLLLYLTTLDDELSENEKESLKEMHRGWVKEFAEFKPDAIHSTITDVEYAYNTLIRGGLKNNKENSVLTKIAEILLAEKCKD